MKLSEKMEKFPQIRNSPKIIIFAKNGKFYIFGKFFMFWEIFEFLSDFRFSGKKILFRNLPNWNSMLPGGVWRETFLKFVNFRNFKTFIDKSPKLCNFPKKKTKFSLKMVNFPKIWNCPKKWKNSQKFEILPNNYFAKNGKCRIVGKFSFFFGRFSNVWVIFDFLVKKLCSAIYF